MILIIIILLALSLAAILIIIGRHLKQLRILNIEILPEEREKKTKANIIAERFRRRWAEKKVILKKNFEPVLKIFKNMQGRMRGRLSELEEKYEQAKRLTLGTRGKRTAEIIGLIREAEESWRAGRLEDAEKKYISVIKLDRRNVDAYEGLGNLYLEMKKYADARQAFEFILKFRPSDASAITSLGEVAIYEGKNEEALEHFRRAVDLRHGNPKYLDFYIETAILLGNKYEAERGLWKMRESNPENQKIGEWEENIKMIENRK